MAESRICELASIIEQGVAKVNSYLCDNNLPQPSFDEHGPKKAVTEGNPEADAARMTAMGAALELYDLLQGPLFQIAPILNGTALQFIYKYNIVAKVPLDGEITFGELSAQIDFKESLVRRILRYAMIHHHVFQETKRGYVSHTAASRLLAEDPCVVDVLGTRFDDNYQAFAHTVEALEKFKGSQEPNEAGWQIAHKTDLPMWEYYASHPAMGKRFANAMTVFTKNQGISPKLLAEGYEWNSINGCGKGTVVDVGGSKGNVCVLLARAAPNLDFIVQDLPGVIADAPELPRDVANRIKFVAHDFLQNQTVRADAYLFRNVFHNWSDDYVIRILKALKPALKPGAAVIINDYVIPEPNSVGLVRERHVRAIDLTMLTLMNARDREKSEWIELFARADPGFKNVRFRLPKGATLVIIDCVWQP